MNTLPKQFYEGTQNEFFIPTNAILKNNKTEIQSPTIEKSFDIALNHKNIHASTIQNQSFFDGL